MEHWYVLFSKPRKEFQVRDQMAQKGLDIYLPLVPPSHSSRHQDRRPLFPRYLFARLDLGCVSPDTIRWTPGLSDFVTFGSDLATVDDTVVAHIQQRLLQAQQQTHAPFRPGQHVLLPPGHPLAALDVVFEKPLSDGERASVLVHMLGRLTRCVVDMHALEAVDAQTYTWL